VTSHIPPERYEARLAAAREALAAAEADAVLVGVGADLRWLTGYEAPPLERLTMLVLPRDGHAALIVPRLELARAACAEAVEDGAVGLVAWDETDDPVALIPPIVAGRVTTYSGRDPFDEPGGGRFGQPGGHRAGPPPAPGGAAVGASSRPPDGGHRRLLVSDRLWASFLLRLQGAFAGAAFNLASTVLRELRMQKDADEVALLRQAAGAADRVIDALVAGRLVGRSEIDLAREVRDRLVAEGHDSAAFSIVGSGPNSASPHHEASERIVEGGEPIVFDIGGTIGGYGSDVTRTIWVSGGEAEPDAEFRHLYGVVQRAQEQAVAAVRPGVTCERIDAVARDVITAEGYGPRFIHRTGHGIGLEEHEDPYIVAGNAERLREGFAFSVEPGIYLDGRYGARIEDVVVCGPDGPDVLNAVPRELAVVDGR
jgi:Xaa-Pro aminopeptidase